MNKQEAAPKNKIAKNRSEFWRACALIVPFYAAAVTIAVAIALQARQNGVPTFISVIYGAFVGALATYYIFHYSLRLFIWVRREFLRLSGARDGSEP